MAPRGAGAARGAQRGHWTLPWLPSLRNTGLCWPLPSCMWELAAGLHSCCPGRNLMAEFLSKKTDWEREDCSMHLLVSHKAQRDPGGTSPSLWQGIGTPGSALSPGLSHCPGRELPGGWAGLGTRGLPRHRGQSCPRQQQPPAPACPGDTGTARKGPGTDGCARGSAASPGKVSGPARPQEAPPEENYMDKHHE